jgi:hypothetical protein
MFTKTLKASILRMILAFIILVFSILNILVVYADTDGNELRTTAQPDKLVLHLRATAFTIGIESRKAELQGQEQLCSVYAFC